MGQSSKFKKKAGKHVTSSQLDRLASEDVLEDFNERDLEEFAVK